MKSFNLLDAQDFERAVEESGLDIGTLRAIRFGMVYGNKSGMTAVKTDRVDEPVARHSTNIFNLAAYKLFRNFNKAFSDDQ